MTGRMMTSGMFSSSTDDWATPKHVFDALDAEFGFTLDVCASDDNHKCPRYFTPADDGLKRSWEGEVCWMNPPYGATIAKWMEKACFHGLNGGICVCLVPARTDTKWWRNYVMQASEVRLIAGRLKYGNAKTGAPFGSAIVIFGTPRAPTFSQWDPSETRAIARTRQSRLV